MLRRCSFTVSMKENIQWNMLKADCKIKFTVYKWLMKSRRCLFTMLIKIWIYVQQCISEVCVRMHLIDYEWCMFARLACKIRLKKTSK